MGSSINTYSIRETKALDLEYSRTQNIRGNKRFEYLCGEY
jgi:hypothetical protein